MSGGSMDYICFKLNDAADYIEDKEIKELTKDLADLLHDLEWYESGDYGRDTYEKSLKEFRKKWFGDSRNDRLKRYLKVSLDELKLEVEKMLE